LTEVFNRIMLHH